MDGASLWMNCVCGLCADMTVEYVLLKDVTQLHCQHIDISHS